MSEDVWKTKARAAEEDYFSKQNKAALATIGDRRVLKSPVSGEPMEQITVHGVNVDRCPSTGGIWLDGGELEQIMTAASALTAEGKQDSLSSFFSSLFKKA